MTEYRVVDGIASTPKGQQLYDQAIAQQNAHRLTNIEHQSNASGDAIIRHVSNRPVTAPRSMQWYATWQDLVDRGFPVVDGIPTPVTKEQAKQQGFSASSDANKRWKNYTKFYNDTYNNYSKQTTQAVLDRQKIYRLITGNPTFAWHGCKYIDGLSICPNFSRHGERTEGTHASWKKINQAPVETSKTMIEGLPIPPPKIIPLPEPEPEPEPEIIEETKTDEYPIAIIMGILVIVIIIILRGKKNA